MDFKHGDRVVFIYDGYKEKLAPGTLGTIIGCSNHGRQHVRFVNSITRWIHDSYLRIIEEDTAYIGNEVVFVTGPDTGKIGRYTKKDTLFNTFYVELNGITGNYTCDNFVFIKPEEKEKNKIKPGDSVVLISSESFLTKNLKPGMRGEVKNVFHNYIEASFPPFASFPVLLETKDYHKIVSFDINDLKPNDFVCILHTTGNSHSGKTGKFITIYRNDTNYCEIQFESSYSVLIHKQFLVKINPNPTMNSELSTSSPPAPHSHSIITGHSPGTSTGPFHDNVANINESLCYKSDELLHSNKFGDSFVNPTPPPWTYPRYYSNKLYEGLNQPITQKNKNSWMTEDSDFNISFHKQAKITLQPITKEIEQFLILTL